MERNFNEEDFKSVVIETSALCNLKCIMCPTLSYKEGFGLMETELFNNLIAQLKPVDHISLEGWGEPLLDKLIFQKVRQAKRKAKLVTFSSNATLVHTFAAEEIIESGIDNINVSMDAGSKLIYERIRSGANFEDVVKNLELLKRLKINMTLTLTLNRMNASDLNNLIKLADSLDIHDVNIKTTDVVSSKDVNRLVLSRREMIETYETAREFIVRQGYNIALNEWDIHEEHKPVRNCLANAINSVFINYIGDVSPCCNLGHHVPRVKNRFFIESDSYKSFGNINEKNIYDIWFSKDMIRFREDLYKNSRPVECKFCRIF